MNRVTDGAQAQVVVKLESFNPIHSVKDRIGVAMILDAEEKGLINKNTVIVEPTSGNTGIAWLMSPPPRLQADTDDAGYNVRGEKTTSLHLRRATGTHSRCGWYERSNQESRRTGRRQSELLHAAAVQEPGQSGNTPVDHGRRIWRDTDGKVDILVAGVGTGGTITGISEVIKKRKPSFKAIAVEPAASPVLSGGKPGPHKIQGIGAGFVPDVFKKEVVDEIIQVTNENAGVTARRLAKEEGF